MHRNSLCKTMGRNTVYKTLAEAWHCTVTLGLDVQLLSNGNSFHKAPSTYIHTHTHNVASRDNLELCSKCLQNMPRSVRLHAMPLNGSCFYTLLFDNNSNYISI